MEGVRGRKWRDRAKPFPSPVLLTNVGAAAVTEAVDRHAPRASTASICWPHGATQGAQEWRERWSGRCADRRTLPLLEVLVELSRMANYIFISKSGSLSIEFMYSGER